MGRIRSGNIVKNAAPRSNGAGAASRPSTDDGVRRRRQGAVKLQGIAAWGVPAMARRASPEGVRHPFGCHTSGATASRGIADDESRGTMTPTTRTPSAVLVVDSSRPGLFSHVGRAAEAARRPPHV